MPVLSPLTLYEISCSKNIEKRERLILTCQILFNKNIYPSICELLDVYEKENFPLLQEELKLLKSSCKYGTIWNKICNDLSRTITIDADNIKKYRINLDKFSKYLYTAIKYEYDEKNYLNDELYIIFLQSVNGLYESLYPIISKHVELNRENIVFYKTNIYFIVLVLVFLNSPFNNTNLFWEQRGISSMKDKIEYIANNLQELLFRGPTVIMSFMALKQSETKFARGYLLDCLHAGYLSYCGVFVSNDDHFHKFSEIITSKMPCKILKLHDDIINGLNNQ